MSDKPPTVAWERCVRFNGLSELVGSFKQQQAAGIRFLCVKQHSKQLHPGRNTSHCDFMSEKKKATLRQKGEWRKQKWLAADISKQWEREKKVESESSSSHRQLSGYLEAEGPQQLVDNMTSELADSQADQRLCKLALESLRMERS